MYHGSRKIFEIDFELLPQNEYTSNASKDLENLFEKFRPKELISRKNAIYLSKDLDLIDPSGGYTDIIYEVKSDYTEKSDLAWYSEAQIYLEEEKVDEAIKCAKKYWNGEPFHDLEHSCFEYRARSAKIISVIELNVPLSELESLGLKNKDIKEFLEKKKVDTEKKEKNNKFKF